MINANRARELTAKSPELIKQKIKEDIYDSIVRAAEEGNNHVNFSVSLSTDLIEELTEKGFIVVQPEVQYFIPNGTSSYDIGINYGYNVITKYTQGFISWREDSNV